MPLSKLEYSFLAPRKIVFGWGRRAEIGALAGGLGRRALLVSGSKTLQKRGVTDEMCAALAGAGLGVERLAEIDREPEVGDVDRAAARCRALPPEAGDFVLAIGGGSAMDLGKAVAALATNRHGESVADFLEGVGKGLQLERPPLPVLAMPTTAGTGSEATKNSVISSYAPPFKKSLRSERMVPQLVLIDPELTVSVPPTITAHTGMDAITQLIESYVSRRAACIPQALCEQGLRLALPTLAEAVADGTSRPARESMAHAALLSGLALANSGLGLAHGVAAALGVHCQVPHGLACAVMLPAALKANRAVREPELARLERLVSKDPAQSDARDADAFIERIDELCAQVGNPRRLSDVGVQPEDIPQLVTGSRGNSMNGNPRDVDDRELRALLESLL